MRSHLTVFTRIPVVLLVALGTTGLVGCSARGSSSGGPSASEQPGPVAAAELGQIALIGGVQDVWPFSFGLNAPRERVLQELGPPVGTDVTPAGTETTAQLDTWTYEGLSFTFFVDKDAGFEQLLTARIASGKVRVRGGLELGMTVDDAVKLLGSPGLVRDDRLVYFYYETTIELAIANGSVSEIILSRALP